MNSYYDYREDYRMEIRRLERLGEKQKAYCLGIPLGIVMILAGIYLIWFVLCRYHLMIANMLYGPALIIGGFWYLWRAYIHSDHPGAVSLAKKLSVNSLSLQKDECIQRIEILKQRAEETEKKLKEYEESGDTPFFGYGEGLPADAENPFLAPQQEEEGTRDEKSDENIPAE